MKMECIFKCYLCSKEYKTEKLIISHLKLDHFIKNNTVEMKCLINGNSCENGFYKFDQLKNHMKKCFEKYSKNENFDLMINERENFSVENNHADVDTAAKLIEESLFITQNIDQNCDNYFSLDSIGIDETYSATPDNNQFFLKNEETNDF